MSVITVEEVREDILDRTYEDHLVLADLAFTDADIEQGMKGCARKFNSIAPIFFCVQWDRLPMNTSVFFDGIAWYLLRRWLRNATMNDIDFSAGNMTASTQGNLIQHFSRLVPELERQFVESATQLKVTRNLQDAFGPIY